MLDAHSFHKLTILTALSPRLSTQHSMEAVPPRGANTLTVLLLENCGWMAPGAGRSLVATGLDNFGFFTNPVPLPKNSSASREFCGAWDRLQPGPRVHWMSSFTELVLLGQAGPGRKLVYKQPHFYINTVLTKIASKVSHVGDR